MSLSSVLLIRSLSLCRLSSPMTSMIKASPKASLCTTASNFRYVPSKMVGVSKKKLRGSFIDASDKVSLDLDSMAEKEREEDPQPGEQFQRFPDENIYETLYDGIKFKDLPVVTIVCAPNNTRFVVTDNKGQQLFYAVPRMYGFENAAKRTNVAAQITATNLGQMLRSNSHRTVRVRIDGFNNGRIAAVKGLTLAGIKVVSVSDVTWIDWDWTRRAKKRKRMN